MADWAAQGAGRQDMVPPDGGDYDPQTVCLLGRCMAVADLVLILAIALFLVTFCVCLFCGDEPRARTVLREGKRMLSIAGLGSRTSIPPYWQNFGKDLTEGLERSSRDFFDDTYPVPRRERAAVAELMHACNGREEAKGYRLVRVVRVESSVMWATYQSKAEAIAQKRGPCSWAGKGPPKTVAALEALSGRSRAFGRDLDPDLNEAYLWHGTKPEAALCIVQDGFKVSMSAVQRFGPGGYFAEDFAKSDFYASSGTGIYDNCFAMLLCRVVLGHQHSVLRDSDYRATDIGIRGHDSTLAEPPAADAAREFIVYESPQVYPEYAIIYERCAPDEAARAAEAAAAEPGTRTGLWASLLGTLGAAAPGSAPANWLHSDEGERRFHEIVPAAEAIPMAQRLMERTWASARTADRRGRDGGPVPEDDPALHVPVGVRALKVRRIEDSDMWRRYVEAQEAIRADLGGSGVPEVAAAPPISTAELPWKEQRRLARDVGEVYLWFGSSPNAVHRIAHSGFDVEFSGRPVQGAAFGKGTCFSEHAWKADEHSRDSGEGYFRGYYAMLLCRVTLGRTQRLPQTDSAHDDVEAGRAASRGAEGLCGGDEDSEEATSASDGAELLTAADESGSGEESEEVEYHSAVSSRPCAPTSARFAPGMWSTRLSLSKRRSTSASGLRPRGDGVCTASRDFFVPTASQIYPEYEVIYERIYAEPSRIPSRESSSRLTERALGATVLEFDGGARARD